MYKLLPLLNVNEELFTPNDALTTATELTINEPVIDWLPLNWFEAVVAYEPVFEFNDAVAVFTLEVKVLIIEPLALSDAVNAFILDVNVLINEPVAITLAVNVLNVDELKNGVTTAKEEVVANPNVDIC